MKGMTLFFPEIDLDGHSGEIEVFPQLVFHEPFVRFLDVLREIAEKDE
jgi:hypothetical protein